LPRSLSGIGTPVESKQIDPILDHVMAIGHVMVVTHLYLSAEEESIRLHDISDEARHLAI